MKSYVYLRILSFYIFGHFCEEIFFFYCWTSGNYQSEPKRDPCNWLIDDLNEFFVAAVLYLGISCLCLSHKSFQNFCWVNMVFFLLSFFLNSCFCLFSFLSHPDFLLLSYAPCLTAFFSLACPFPTLALQSLPSIPRAQRLSCARCTQEILWSWTARYPRQLPSCGPKTARRLFRTTVRSLSASGCTSAMLHRVTRACTHARPLALRPLMRFASLLMSQVRRHGPNLSPTRPIQAYYLKMPTWSLYGLPECVHLSLGRTKPPF